MNTVKKKAYIYVEERFKKGGSVLKSLLPIEYTFTIPKTQVPSFARKQDRDAFQKAIEKHITENEMLMRRTKAQAANGSELELVKIEPTFIRKKSRFYEGEYFAHEYNEFAEGRMRRIEYNNGFVEYEVECLDKSLTVLDGMYSEEDRYGDRYTNGYGDFFETHDTTSWTMAEHKQKKKKGGVT